MDVLWTLVQWSIDVAQILLVCWYNSTGRYTKQELGCKMGRVWEEGMRSRQHMPYPKPPPPSDDGHAPGARKTLYLQWPLWTQLLFGNVADLLLPSMPLCFANSMAEVNQLVPDPNWCLLFGCLLNSLQWYNSNTGRRGFATPLVCFSFRFCSITDTQ